MTIKDIQDDVVDYIKHNEGFNSKMYYDTQGIPTIGYGRNLKGNGISQEEGELLLSNDLKTAILSLYTVFTKDFFLSLNKLQQKGLVDMMYNLGINRFKKFIKMIQAIKDKDFKSAYNEIIDSKWHVQLPLRSHKDASYIDNKNI